MLSRWGVVAALGAALAGPTAAAHAVIPQGNTLLNGDGETGQAVTDETSNVCPQGWTCTPAQPDMTLIRYGTTTFPSVAEAARIGGGRSLFAGGPDNAVSSAAQTVVLGEQPELETAGVKAAFGGCLGGFLDQSDLATLELRFFTRDNPDQGVPFTLSGPTAAARGNKTTLLPVSRIVDVPPETMSFRLTLSFIGETGGYNTGFADNLSVSFGAAPTAPACSVPQGGGPGGPGPPDPPPGGGRGEPVKLLTIGTALIGADGKARMKVKCNTSQLRRCQGSMSAALVPAKGKAKKPLALGRVKFSVPSLKTRTVTLRLSPSKLRALRALPKRKLAARRIRLRATTKLGITTLTQTSLLKVKLRG
jgi:hypothetical protein